MIIEGILQESRDLYLNQHRHLVGLLIHIPKGSLRDVQRSGNHYWYLRRYTAERGYADAYLGPLGTRATEAIVNFIGQRKSRIKEPKAVRQALKSLGSKEWNLKSKAIVIRLSP